MRATAMFFGAFLALSASGCAEEEFNSGGIADGGSDATCSTACETGFACVARVCEPSGNWSLYVKSASIAGTHKWDDTPVMAEWPPDPAVCATSRVGAFNNRCSPTETNTTTPSWTSTTATYGHLLGVAEAGELGRGVEVTLNDDDSGTLEIMCATTVTPTRLDFFAYAMRGLRATCATGLAKDSVVELVLRPGG